MPMAQYSIEIW